MRKFAYIIVGFYLPGLVFGQTIHHEMKVYISVKDHHIEVQDEITFPREYLKNHPEITFTLNSELKIGESEVKIRELTVKKNEKFKIQVKKYRLRAPSKSQDYRLSLNYKGEIYDRIKEGAAEYARSFSETSGIIFEDGIYLAGSTHWVPEPEGFGLTSFNIETSIDTGWLVLSQGTRTFTKEKDGRQLIRYESPEPMDEIYLVGGKWTEYDIPSDHVLFQAFLRTPDEKLAQKYLGATQGYLSMYEKMIGPYPFTKFALVENFWETGYGMPSFTLLGPKVIRFPWILYSSYPHELLHNYWGNSVYVDYEKGNWCEGITAYMADHLLKEQQGQGAEYRRNTLQKYTDFVNSQNDFPLSKFLSRKNSAEEAIGYGKCLMVNNMLRENFGDKTFLAAWAKFYKDYKFKIASWEDIRRSFEAITGEDLKPFFTQWVEEKGAPSLKLSDVKSTEGGTGFNLSFKLEQIQQEGPFSLDIPVAVFLEDDQEVKLLNVSMDQPEQHFLFNFNKKPVRIEIDPTFQIFRRLDRREVPTTLTQLFGAKEAIIVLPSESPLYESYKKLAEIWKSSQSAQGKLLFIKSDKELDKLPDKAVWVVGFDNKFAPDAEIPAIYMDKLSADEKVLKNKLKDSGALTYAIQNPVNKSFTLCFVAANSEKAISGLARKLPHYGKYSYLGFEGNEPANVLKGTFPAIDSPLNFSVLYDGKTLPVSAKIIPRQALNKVE
jgi:hypothetical protein